MESVGGGGHLEPVVRAARDVVARAGPAERLHHEPLARAAHGRLQELLHLLHAAAVLGRRELPRPWSVISIVSLADSAYVRFEIGVDRR